LIIIPSFKSLISISLFRFNFKNSDMEFIFKNENNMSLFELNIVFFNIRYPVKISRNGNAIKMLFIITVNENG